MSSKTEQQNMDRLVCNCTGKCVNCYYYGAPCLNCMCALLTPTVTMTYEEYKKSSHTDQTYEEFCKECEDFRKKHVEFVTNKESVEYKDYIKEKCLKKYKSTSDDDYDYYSVCRGPYNESMSRCFGPCCN